MFKQSWFVAYMGHITRPVSELIVYIKVYRNKKCPYLLTVNVHIYFIKTRTHSMAHHRKSQRSRRNLIVIDPLTPSQGHQFDCRLKFSVNPRLLFIPFYLICHMTMFRKLNFLPPITPKVSKGAKIRNR